MSLFLSSLSAPIRMQYDAAAPIQLDVLMSETREEDGKIGCAVVAFCIVSLAGVCISFDLGMRIVQFIDSPQFVASAEPIGEVDAAEQTDDFEQVERIWTGRRILSLAAFLLTLLAGLLLWPWLTVWMGAEVCRKWMSAPSFDRLFTYKKGLPFVPGRLRRRVERLASSYGEEGQRR